MRLRLRIPPVEPDKYASPPDRCPACGNKTWHSHGWAKKPLRDTRLEGVRARRVQCTACGKTVRLYPQGVTHRDQSERLRGLSILLWLLGASYRAVEDILVALACRLSHVHVYENVQETGEKVRQLQEKRLPTRQVRVLGADCTHVRVKGEETILLQITDGEKGVCLGLQVLQEEDAESLREGIEEVAKAVGAEVLLTDDADALKEVADALGLEHQLCQQHVVPNTLALLVQIAGQLEKRLEGAEEKPVERAKIEQAMADVSELEEMILWRCPGSQGRLDALARRYEQEPLPRKGQRATPFARLKLLTMDLAADWPRLTLTERLRDAEQRQFIPSTNNVSERGIGQNIKERYRTMRGYKSERSLLRVTTLTAHLRDEGDEQALIRALSA